MSQVFVGGLSDATEERDLEEAFRQYGDIRKIDLRSGFAFVEYRRDADAERAIDRLDGTRIRCAVVRVERSMRRNKRCFKCNKSGHFAEDCPLPDRAERDGNRQRDDGKGRRRSRDTAPIKDAKARKSRSRSRKRSRKKRRSRSSTGSSSSSSSSSSSGSGGRTGGSTNGDRKDLLRGWTREDLPPKKRQRSRGSRDPPRIRSATDWGDERDGGHDWERGRHPAQRLTNQEAGERREAGSGLQGAHMDREGVERAGRPGDSERSRPKEAKERKTKKHSPDRPWETVWAKEPDADPRPKSDSHAGGKKEKKDRAAKDAPRERSRH